MFELLKLWRVSTHSRPKAAAAQAYAQHLEIQSFNTQPPEGGCNGRLAYGLKLVVSTHSRPKAAAYLLNLPCDASVVSTHSRPKAAAKIANPMLEECTVSTHSRPKAAAM